MGYQYKKLDRNHAEIRLPTLFPGSGSDELQCSTSVVSLDDNPAFKALSYVWGDVSITRPIIADGNTLEVTPTLDDNLGKEDTLHNPERLLRAYDGLLDIMCRDYWGRMWTYQEYLLAAEDPRFVGEKQDELYGFLRNLQVTVKCRIRLYPGMRTNLMEELLATRTRECLDPRDKVFALYELVGNARQAYPADYTKPVEQVMAETAAYIINHENPAHIYVRFNLRESRLSDRSHPSWAPDFTDYFTSFLFPKYHADTSGLAAQFGGLRQPWPRFKVTSDYVLRMSAFNLGECNVALRFTTDVSDMLKRLADINVAQRLDEEPASRNSLQSKLRPDLDPVSRLARACIAHRWRDEGYVHELRNEFVNVCQAAAQGTVSPDSFPALSVEKFIIESIGALSGKALFTTACGCPGIGDGEDGDPVLLTPLFPYPVVLRQEFSVEPGGGETYYRIVGMPYVDGVWEGDGPHPTLADEIRKQGLQEFLIR
ncbi:Uu.00g110870.m01.CDS01 [Anthostomella pinea]|uniref:Uu.00g110870.m01.CDS01 n=1 Tax=Anthostomella pinea TaxID=933095 RepID=A0AAI8VEY3_9PEZI|nr:Uu.00g110870.m01.CDS01 [Anthostomella pinea]